MVSVSIIDTYSLFDFLKWKLSPKSTESPLTDVLPSFIRSSASDLGSGFDDLVDFKVFLDFLFVARFLLNKLLEFFLNNQIINLPFLCVT